MLMIPKEGGPVSTATLSILTPGAVSPHTSSVSSQHHHSETRSFLFTHEIHSFESVCILDRNSLFHIPHAAATLVFLACCLDILTEATYLPCHASLPCLFASCPVAFAASLLCLSPLSPP